MRGSAFTFSLLLTIPLCSLLCSWPAFTSPAEGGDLSIFATGDGTVGRILDLGGGLHAYQDNYGTAGLLQDLGGGFHAFQNTRGTLGTAPNPDVFRRTLDLSAGPQTAPQPFQNSDGPAGSVPQTGGRIQAYQDSRGNAGTVLDLGGGQKTFQFAIPARPRSFGAIQKFSR